MARLNPQYRNNPNYGSLGKRAMCGRLQRRGPQYARDVSAITRGETRAGAIVDCIEASLPELGLRLGAVAARELEELKRRERLYRGGRPFPDLHGGTVILVDDGLATGATMEAAIQGLRQLKPARIVVAVPVASRETCDALRPLVDDLICAVTPEPFYAVGHWYEDFSQTSDAEVRELLAPRERAESLPTQADAGRVSLRARSHSTNFTTSVLRHIQVGKRRKPASASLASTSSLTPRT